MRLFKCPPPAAPWRLSASVVIAAPRGAVAGPVEWREAAPGGDDSSDYRVCMLKRSLKGSFGGTLVFPGGTVEAVDRELAGGAEGDVLRVCAVREAFEEAGAVLMNPRQPGAAVPAVDRAWRERVHSDAQEFTACLDAHGLDVAVDALHEWVSFTTPDPQAAKMKNGGFETVFYAAALPEGRTAGMGSDHAETTWMVWCTPKECLAAFEAGLVTLPPPQWCIMEELAARVPSLADLPTYAASPARALLRDHHIKPYRIVPDSSDPPEARDGSWRACYPGDELHPIYPGRPGDRHRIHIQNHRITRDLNLPPDHTVPKAAAA